jgi:hypothetical protein
MSIPFRSDLPHCADYDWLLRTIRRVPFLYFEDSLVDLRQHAGQASTKNLRSARDILESYQILRSNLSAFPGDVPQIEAVRICLQRFRLVIRRAAGQFANLRIISGLDFLAHSFRFLMLLAIHQRARLSRHPL